LILILFAVAAWSQQKSIAKGAMAVGPKPIFLLSASQSRSIPNGIELHSGTAIIHVIALRDDILRVRISSSGQLPEDASWAVLNDARTHRVEVKSERSTGTIGFSTRSVRVQFRLSNSQLTVSDLAGNVLQEDAFGWPVEFHGEAFRLYKRMPEDEHYFGLGDKVGPLDRRNQAFTLWNSDTYSFQESTDPIYKSIPFFLTFRQGRACGVLLDNTWRSSFDFGKQSAGVYSFGAEHGPIDYYLIYGPEPKQVLTAYAWLTGTPPLPPLWSFGYQQSRYSYETEARVREIATQLRQDRIPADAVYLDIDFQQQHRPFTVDTTNFPHFRQMVSDLKKQNLHVVAITDLHVADVHDKTYAPYVSGMQGDHFVKNPDGSTYVGVVWPGPSVFPDFTRQQSRAWWGSLYSQLVQDGISGFWNDMNEPSIFKVPSGTMPDDVQHRIDEPGFEKRTATHLEIHNVYGMENSRATYEGLLKLQPNQRPFVLTRATYAGGQRYAATWTGDNSSTWNHLRLTTPMLLNLGLSGFGLSGADVGGFIGTPTPELLTKWFEVGAFHPIDRDHTEKGTADQEPWVHGTAQENIRRRFIEERYRLIPYIYSLAEEMSRTGVPMLRPMFLEFSKATSDGHPFDIDASNQFLLGPDVLVAPAPFPEKPFPYEVRLPAVDWYDYWTGKHVPQSASNEGRDARVTVHPELDQLPVFIRAGAIVPMQPLTQSTAETPQGPLTLRVYPGKDCQGSLYLDDGISMAYAHGDYLRMNFTCEQTLEGVRVHIGEHTGTYQAWWKQLRLEVYGWSASNAEVLLGGKQLSDAASIDSTRESVSIEVPDEGHGADVELIWRVNSKTRASQ
jgi:alpha-glucosidase